MVDRPAAEWKVSIASISDATQGCYVQLHRVSSRLISVDRRATAVRDHDFVFFRDSEHVFPLPEGEERYLFHFSRTSIKA
jgi:hypothetical protein